MAYKLDANTANDHTIFELMSMVRGTITMDRHYFFNMVKPATGEAIDFKSFLGGTIPKTEDGKRIPMNKQANNPALTAPTVTGMKFFGQLPLFKAAVDQLHAKKIGVFPTATHGAGMNAFDFQNNDLFKSADSLMNIVGKIMFGAQAGNIKDESHQLFNPLKALADQVGKGGGADSKTQINPSGDAQKLIQMCAAGFTKDGKNPFSGSALSDGVSMAKDVSQYIKKLTG